MGSPLVLFVAGTIADEATYASLEARLRDIGQAEKLLGSVCDP
jgi:hypothetical protein